MRWFPVLMIVVAVNGQTLLNTGNTECPVIKEWRGKAFQKQIISFLTWFSKVKFKHGNSEAVKFDKVIENIGGGYDPSTGKFTAPVSGIYSISVSIMSEPINAMHLGIMRNGQRLSVLYSHNGTYPQATNTLNLSMKNGDTVWVQIITGEVLHVNTYRPYNVFSGALIAMM